MLLDEGEREGCLSLSEVEAIVERCELDEENVASLHEQLDRRQIEVTDDWRPRRALHSGRGAAARDLT